MVRHRPRIRFHTMGIASRDEQVDSNMVEKGIILDLIGAGANAVIERTGTRAERQAQAIYEETDLFAADASAAVPEEKGSEQRP